MHNVAATATCRPGFVLTLSARHVCGLRCERMWKFPYFEHGHRNLERKDFFGLVSCKKCCCCFPQCSSNRSLWILLPSRQGFAYQPQLHEVSLCLWETLALEITYVVNVITHCHCVRIVVTLSARYCIETIHSYGNLLNLESPSDGLLRYCLPPNEGTRLSGRRIVTNFLSATSRTVPTICLFSFASLSPWRYPTIGRYVTIHAQLPSLLSCCVHLQ